jgi:hypothetical protein
MPRIRTDMAGGSIEVPAIRIGRPGTRIDASEIRAACAECRKERAT